MMELIAMGILLLVPAEEPVFWVFFSPDSPDASRIFKELEGRRVRPVLLAERYFGTREPSADFLATAEAAAPFGVVDEEGLREAERLGIRALPAVAVTVRGKTHVAVGNRPDLKELLKCALR